MSRLVVRLMLIAVVILVLIGSTIIFSGLRILEMDSPTMEPAVLGRSHPGRSDGDRLLITTRVRAGNIRCGDLVVVRFASWTGAGMTRTVRRVTGLPGDSITDRSGSLHLLGPECFWLEAQQTNGLDSHAMGPVHRDSISGRVIGVFHVRRSAPASIDAAAGASE